MKTEKKRKETVFSAWKKTFSDWKYIVLALVVAVIFYSLDIFFSNFKSVTSLISNSGFFAMLKAFPGFTTVYINFFPIRFFISLIILSVLFGMLFSLISYKTKMIKTASGKVGIFVTLGIFLGILAPGCPACGVGILSVLGIGSAAINFLPFGGFGLILFSIAIMGFSVYKISKDINRGIICEVELPKETIALKGGRVSI